MNLSTQSGELQNHPHSLPKRNFFLTNKMKKEIGGIQTYSDFQEEYPNIGRMENWYLSLDRLKNKLGGIDPIEYLIYLYLKGGKGDGLSIIDIYEEIKEFLHIKEETSFYNFIHKLGWNKRTKKITTEYTREKIRKSRINGKTHNAEITLREKTVLEIFSIIDGNRKEQKEFNEKVFSVLKNTVEKTRYILDVLGYIDSEKFIETIKILVKENSLLFIQLTIQYILNNLPSNFPKVNFNRGRVSEIINGYYD